MRYTRAIVTGSMSWDIIMDFPSRFMDYLQPDMLHQINVSFVVDSLEKNLGGTATNIAYALRQTLGFLNSRDKGVFILGALGKDGGEHIRFFKENGISTEGIITNKTLYSASGSVITDRNDNQIWGFYYGACRFGKHADFKTLATRDSLMIISANHPDAFLAAQRHAIAHRIPYLYDVGMAMSWIKLADLKNGVTHAKYLVGNDYEIALITKTLKTTVPELVKKGIDVITTLGEKGVRFATDSAAALLPTSARKLRAVGEPLRPRHLLQNVIHIPAVKVKKVVDPTGAGDAWRGGFMAGLLADMPIVECLRLGNAVASFSVEELGTVKYRLKKSELTRRMKLITI